MSLLDPQSAGAAPPRRFTKARLAIAVAGLSALLISIGFFAASDGESSRELVRAALVRLDRKDAPADWETARNLAERARRAGDRDLGFRGGAEFVLGVVSMRRAALGYDRSVELTSAVKLLREADREGVSGVRRPEWAYALGMSLHALGRPDEARPLLEEALATFESGASDAGLALAEIEIGSTDSDSIRRADEFLSSAADRSNLSSEQQQRLVLLRARAALKAGRLWEAETALSELAGAEPPGPQLALLWAELRVLQDRPEDAREWLLPVAFPTGATNDASRASTAAFLLGRCEEKRGDAASALRAYERAAGLSPDSADGTAGALAAGRLLQQASRDEEALALFRQAIASQAASRPAPVRTELFRSEIRAAWEEWVERREYDLATGLGEACEAVLGAVDSLELQSKSREKAAERIESEWQQCDEPGRTRLQHERLLRWRQSGAVHRALADAVNDTGRTSTALWTAADHLRRGHSFVEAEAALTGLIQLQVPNLQAAALVRRAHTRLDLDRPQEATLDLLMVLDRHPTAPEAFEARLLLGRAYRDAGEDEKAEATWRQLLSLDELTPAAREWRAGLLSLAELLYRRGIAAIDRSQLTPGAPEPRGQEAILLLDEAISRLGEYLRRSSDSPRAAEARVLRADALRRRAMLARRAAAFAETDNLREISRREADRLLDEAMTELRAAQLELVPLADHERLARRGSELLKATFFDLGHVYAALGRDREAVVTYGAAINRYPDDARVVAAHLRIAECQRRLGRPDDARAAAEQARLLLDQLPARSLEVGASALDREDWIDWLARIGEPAELARPAQ